MKDSLKIALGIVLGALTLCIIAALCYGIFGLGFLLLMYGPSTPEVIKSPTLPLATSTPAPKQFSLPYSTEENGLRLTVLEVIPATEKHGILVSEDYRQWTVNFKYENLLNTDWESGEKLPYGHCAEIAHEYRLETNQGNIYKPRYVGGASFCGRLEPKATLLQKELYILEIRKEENPVRLLGYNEQSQLIYIFPLRQ
jgi:hypothetical protein